MKLIIFGATGSVGHHIVRQALVQEHEVTAFARNPDALNLDHASLSLIAGDVYDLPAVSRAIKGHDAVLITLGSKSLTGNLRSEGTANIISAMQEHWVSRLICQTTLGVGNSRGNLNFFWKYVMFGMLLRAVYKDHIIQENIVRSSGLDWTIVRPAAFTHGPETGIFKHGFSAQEKHLTLKIARADVAHFMLQQLISKRYLRWTPGLSY
ncbi:Flavin reductase [hydrothermal vent metagenome]|uniref:Flavin reductase n=1 Tax=hydrothermal vent metagenome TaxID=652676 RepID=A0A3B0RS29_9ZZZZ